MAPTEYSICIIWTQLLLLLQFSQTAPVTSSQTVTSLTQTHTLPLKAAHSTSVTPTRAYLCSAKSLYCYITTRD